MAQKVQITLLCDLDDGNVEADETLQFSLVVQSRFHGERSSCRFL